MLSLAQTLSRLGFLFARNREGLNQEEAKKLFFQFRRKNAPAPGEPEPPSGQEEITERMMSFMQDTAQKLDRIEADIDYLKTQVNQILKKI